MTLAELGYKPLSIFAWNFAKGFMGFRITKGIYFWSCMVVGSRLSINQNYLYLSLWPNVLRRFKDNLSHVEARSSTEYAKTENCQCWAIWWISPSLQRNWTWHVDWTLNNFIRTGGSWPFLRFNFHWNFITPSTLDVRTCIFSIQEAPNIRQQKIM